MERDERALIQREREQIVWLRWYFWLGCFGLPFVHFVTVLYFYPELRAVHNSNFRIRQYCYLSLIVGITESLIWLVWFIIFQIFHDNEQIRFFQALNILNDSTDYTIATLV